MVQRTLQFPGMLQVFVTLFSLFIATAVAQYGFTTPTNGVGSVAINDNATYPFYFYNVSTNITGLRFSLYTILPQNSGFQVNPATGQVYVDAAKSSIQPPLQYEIASQYVLTILATDSIGIATATASLTVNITKVHHAPVFTTAVDTIVTVSESTTLPVVIYTASATCAANDAPISWSMDYVTPTGNGSLFNIDVRGRIFLVNPAGQLNYTIVPVYVIYYFASDDVKSLTATATLTVSVTPSNHFPIINNLPANISIPTNIIAPTPFYFLSVSDPDDTTNGQAQQLGMFKYGFSVSPIEGFQKFQISSIGTVSTVINDVFDYSSQPYYLVTIWVTDWGSPARTATGTLNVTIIGSTTSSTNTSTSSTSSTSSTTTSSSSSVDQTTIIGAVVGVIGGLMVLGGILAATLLCCKGRATGGIQQAINNNQASSSSKTATTTVYEDEHVYFNSKLGRSAIVSPFSTSMRPAGGRL